MAVVLDPFSRWFEGWSMKAERDAPLVMDALMMANWRSGKADALVILPVLTGPDRRTYAAIFSFMAGVTPPMPMLGRSLL